MMLLRRLKTLVFLATLWASPALAQGTIPLAMSVQTDNAGNIAAGCLLYFFQAGTVSTPQNSYSDFGLSQNPLSIVQCNQSGRLPMFWLANGLIHVRLTDSAGSQIIDTTMQVLGPSSGGGGGGGTVDPTTILSTGDEKIKYGTGPLTGFVRENGLTIGNSTSGATERANADTQALFIYLYGADPNLVVSGGRTGNALNDYNASKTIVLPDMRGMANVGLADMGNTATSVLTPIYAGCGSVTTLGEACGSQNQNIGQTNLPNVSPTFTGTQQTWNSTSQFFPGNANINCCGTGGATVDQSAPSQFVQTTITPAGTISPLGNGTPLSIVQPVRLKTFYIKL